MTALVLENLADWASLARAARIAARHLGRALDLAVKALAARSVPEWKIQEAQARLQQVRNLRRANARRNTTRRRIGQVSR